MKRLIIVFVTALGLAFASVASAGGGYGHRGHGWGHKFHGSYGWKGHGYKGHGYRGHRYKYKSYGYGHRHRYHDHRAGYLVGGLILGSALTYAFTRPRYYYDSKVVHYVPAPRREVVYYAERPAEPRVSGRRLHRDRWGNCFEIRLNFAGDELRTELDPGQCNW